MIKKSHSVDDLVNFYYSCPLFRKYYQYNLWFGSFGEYDNLIYCTKFINRYVYCWVHFFLLQRFSLSFVIFLYKSPCFMKFLESGFIKYLDYKFLLSFSNNSFRFDNKSKQRLKQYIKSYFYSALKKQVEKDLLILVTKTKKEIIFLQYPIKLLEMSQISVGRILISNKHYLVGFFYFFFLIRKDCYKLNIIDFGSSHILKCSNNIYKPLPLILKLYFKSVNIQNLIDYFEIDVLSEFKNRKIDIGLHKNTNIFFEECLNTNIFFPTKNLEIKKNIFNKYFINYTLRKYNPGIV